jgi:uncharacterized membrane protein YeaQ/YmgE (transglycosylase-associated protein family)
MRSRTGGVKQEKIHIAHSKKEGEYEFHAVAHYWRHPRMDRQSYYGYRRAEGVFLNIVVGVIGALLAGFLLTPLFGVGTINQNNFSLPALFVSLLGAIVLLAVVHLFRRGTVR